MRRWETAAPYSFPSVTKLRCLAKPAEFGAGAVGKEGKDKDAGPMRELAPGCGSSIADDGRGLVEAPHPARARGISQHEPLVLDARGFEDRARNLDEVGPARRHADESALERREPGVKPCAGGADLKRDKFDACGKDSTDSIRLAGTTQWNSSKKCLRIRAVFKRCGRNRHPGKRLNLG